MLFTPYSLKAVMETLIKAFPARKCIKCILITIIKEKGLSRKFYGKGRKTFNSDYSCTSTLIVETLAAMSLSMLSSTTREPVARSANRSLYWS